MSDLYQHSEQDPVTNWHHLHCNRCGKRVSSPYLPLPVTLVDGKPPSLTLVVRALIVCPECMPELFKAVEK